MMGKANCEFKGVWTQYLPTMIIHLFLLTGLTLGIYMPWAWVRLLKLKSSHTLIHGKSVSFTGTGGQLFVLILIQGLLTLITFSLYFPWAATAYFRWRAQKTLVAGKPGQFKGTGGALFLFYLIHLMVLPILTLGIYNIYGFYRFYAWKEENTRYGGARTSFGASFWGFVKIQLVILVATLLITLAISFIQGFSGLLSVVFLLVYCLLFPSWVVCSIYGWQTEGLAVGDDKRVKHFEPVKTNYVVLAALLVFGIIICISAGYFISKQINNLIMLKNLFGTAQMEQFKVDKPSDSFVPSPRLTFTPVKRPDAPTGPAKPVVPTLPAKKLGQKKMEYLQEINKLDALIKEDSGNADAFYNRAWMYAAGGNLEHAQEDYAKALGLDEKFEEAYYNRGLLFVRMKKYAQAVKDFDAVIRLNPLAADAYCNRGSANFQMGRSALAIKDYTEALKIKHNDTDSLYNRGVAYMAKGERPKAMEDLREAARLGHGKAVEYLKMLPAKTETPKRPTRTSSLGWRMDLEGVKIPEAAAAGMIHGEEFVMGSAKIENGVLTIRDGEDFFPDHAVMIFLFLKNGDTGEGKTYHVTGDSGFGTPHIHMKWRMEEKNIPETEMFMKDYIMRLDLGNIVDGTLPGKVYLCLPDDMKSFVAGSFEAIVK